MLTTAATIQQFTFNPERTIAPEKQRCRFDLFVRSKKDSPQRFINGKKEWCFRGDKYEKEKPDKMLKYLLGIVKNYYRQYAIIELYDNSIPSYEDSRVVLRILHGEIKRNRLTSYTALLINFSLPEIFSYEITDQPAVSK